MKKIFSFILAVLLCISLISCTLNKSAEPSNKKENTEEQKLPDKEEKEEEQKEENTEKEEFSDYTPLLYKVTDDDGSIIWLFGSIHLGREDMIPLPDYVMDAYDSADALAVECNILEMENDLSSQIEFLKPLLYDDGTKIYDHISEELYESSVEILEENGSYNAFFDYYKPILWQTLIESFAYEKSGLCSDYGIDMNLLNFADESGKEILEIESIEFQYGMLTGFSDELQILLLEEIVDQYGDEESHASLLSLVEAWCEGNVEGILSSEESDLSDMSAEEIAMYEEYNKAMLVDRNINMADFAQTALENDNEVFICVGAAHVVGDGGMADLLEKSGYTIEIIQG